MSMLQVAPVYNFDAGVHQAAARSAPQLKGISAIFSLLLSPRNTIPLPPNPELPPTTLLS
jgi:hypothetical protein